MISKNKPKALILCVITILIHQCLGQPSFGNSPSTAGNPGLVTETLQVKEKYLSNCDTSIFLAGDSIITQPWSHITDPSFQRLIGEIRAVDAAIVNLEMLIHEYRGYPQAESGGIHLAAPPDIATELAWAGIDMVAHANNHTFDYGSLGVLENLENVEAAGLVLAGSGKDLQHARAPQYFNTTKKTVGLVSAASTFASFGKASRSRPDMHGRPGLNPLTTTENNFILVTKETADFLGSLSKFLGYQGGRFSYDSFNLFGIKFKVGDRYGVEYGQRILKKDLEGNLKSIRQAVESAEIVVMSLHAHHKMEEWLTRFSHDVIDAGVDKSKGIHGLSQILIDKYKGKVPSDIALLEELPAVGHKTASVVVSQAFGIPAFPVDTHIHRLMYRWGFSNGKNVVQTEKDAKRLFPRDLWNDLHLQIIWYGREYSPARGWDIEKDVITKTIGRKKVLDEYFKNKKLK